MGRAIVIGATLVLLLLVAGGFAVWFAGSRQKQVAREKGLPLKGDLSRAQEQLILRRVDEAEALILSIMTPGLITSEWSHLSERHRQEAQVWLDSLAEIK